MKNFKILIKSILIVILISILSLASLGLYLHFNKDKIIHKIVNELEKKLKVKISVAKTKVKLEFESLDIGIGLENLKIIDKKQASITLLKAKEVYFSLGLIKLIKGKYIINNIKISDGNIKIDLSNEIFNQKNDKTTLVNINNIFLKKVNFLVFNSKTGNNKYEFSTNKLKLNLLEKKKLLNAEIEGNLFFKEFKYKKINLKQIFLGLNINLLYNKLKEILILKPSSILKLNNAPISLKGTLHLKRNKKINLNIKSIKNIDITSFLNLKAEVNKNDDSFFINIQRKLKNHINKAIISFNLNIKDNLNSPSIFGKLEIPVLSIKFKDVITNLNLKNLKANLNLKPIETFKDSSIEVDLEEARFGKGTFKTKFKIDCNNYIYSNKESYKTKLLRAIDSLNCIGKIQGNLEPKELFKISNKSQFIDNIDGDISFSMDYNFPLNGISKFKLKEMPILNGNIKLNNVSILKNNIKIEDINGNIPLVKSDIGDTNISMKINKDLFDVRVSIRNILELFSNKTIKDGLNKSAPFTNNDEKLTISVSTFSEETIKDGLNKSAPFTNNDEKLTTSVSTFSEETIKDGLNKSAPFTNNDEKLTTSVSTFSEEGYEKDNDKKVNINLKLNSQTLDLGKILKQYSNKKEKNLIKISKNIVARIEIKINNINKDKISFEDFYSKSRIYDQILFLDKIKGKIAGGKFEIKGILDIKGSYPTIKAKGKTTRLYLNQLLDSFDNFGQVFITSKNLKGELFTNFDFNLTLDKYGNPFWNSLNSNIEFYIKDGLLYNFMPLLALNYIIDKSKLKQIYFKKPIKNKIYIKSSMIYIPKVMLVSNIMDILISGWHSFDNRIHYEFVLPLKGNLRLKNKSITKQEGLELPTLKAFVTLDGNIKNPKIKFDIKDTIKDTLANQAKDIAKIIFGKYKSKKKSKQLEQDEYFDFE